MCPVNSTATDAAKRSAGCDRDEGPVDVRFTAAAQAYMEWMPLRRGPGSMGVVTTTSITQVMEWGKLASVVLFDTRISYRSKEPTLDSCTFVYFLQIVDVARHLFLRSFLFQFLASLLRLPIQM